uniref:Uncharacterized protein n=1 Tax=Avena sativa TaxID=4498 RepID=A0ACD5Z4H0_AVESA
MAPKKVPMEYIAHAPTRKLACKQRAMGVIKKAGELSVLCGVEACAVVYPEGEAAASSSSSQMHVYPSLLEARAMADRLRSMPVVEQRRKKMDGEGYVRERVAKVKEQLSKAERDNGQRETMLRLHEAVVGRRPSLDGLSVEQLVGMGWTTENLIQKIKDCIADRGGAEQAGVNADPLPTVADVEVPRLRAGWVMEVVKAGLDLDAVPCGGSRSANAGGGVMQLGNTDAGFA